MIKKTSTHKWILYGSIVLFGMIPYNSFSQSVKRQSISSYGAANHEGNNVMVSSTAGQSYNSSGSTIGEISLLPGFQQSSTFSVEEVINPEPFRTLNLTAFPNPATYSVTLHSTEEITSSIIRVIDSNGREVFNDKVTALSSYSIDCGYWNNGIYFITVTDDADNFKTLKLIISK
jgi:hypothetical protein